MNSKNESLGQILILLNLSLLYILPSVVLRVYIMYKSCGGLYYYRGSDIVRNRTYGATEARWEIMRAMLNDFPELRIRTSRYLRSMNTLKKSASRYKNTEPEDLLQRALDDFHQERSRKQNF